LPLPLMEFVASYHRDSIATERLVVVLRQNVVIGANEDNFSLLPLFPKTKLCACDNEDASRDGHVDTIRSFAIVAEELRFRRAAERAHMAQSALTCQIKLLQKKLGVLLFVRDRRSVRAEKGGPEPTSTSPILNCQQVYVKSRYERPLVPPPKIP
jgi:Bacterial regulatory helix-turn-helix protein, lysR family